MHEIEETDYKEETKNSQNITYYHENNTLFSLSPRECCNFVKDTRKENIDSLAQAVRSIAIKNRQIPNNDNKQIYQANASLIDDTQKQSMPKEKLPSHFSFK